MGSENALVSVIMPVYNVEKYLSQCINSVCTQTYNNLEIIIVDDESPDDSGTIADEYAKLAPKFAEKEKKIAEAEAAYIAQLSDQATTEPTEK